MANIVISGDSSGSVTLSAPAVSGTTVLTLPTTSGTLVVAGGAQTIEFADGTVSAPSITNSGDTNTGIYFPAADTIAFTEGGVESMRIDASGNVGIGVTAPAVRLDLLASGSGDIVKFGVPASSRIINFYRDSANFAVTDASGIAGNGMYGITTTNNLAFLTNSGERMRINSSGQVGIGTSSPSQLLSIYADGVASSPLVNFDRGGVFTGYCGTDGAGAIFGSTSNHLTRFITNGTEKMRITAGGSLLLGTTDDADKLTVNGNMCLNTSIGYVFSNGGGSSGSVNSGIGFDGGGSTMRFFTGGAGSERMRITSGGFVLMGKTTTGLGTNGVEYEGANGGFLISRGGNPVLLINRNSDDGTLVEFRQDNSTEGSISVSGSTVSYNGGHLSRWSQLPDGSKDETLLKGTVMSNLDDMCVWEKDGVVAENEQLNKMKVSDVEGDTNVAGVFVNWTIDEQYGVDDMNVAMTGDMIIRIADGVVVQKGDLLMSAGDGTAKPQGDDIVRSKTVAKVTSNYVTCTYADGSYCVPCVLMAC